MANTWTKTTTPDLCFMTDDWYELFSSGDRGIISYKNGVFTKDYDKLQYWVAESQEAGINGIGILIQAPWQSKTLEDLFCPYVYLKDKKKFTIRQINPEWEETLDTCIRKILEVAPENYIVRIMMFDFCQTHWGAPNPFYNKDTGKSNNIEGYKHFYDIPLYREIEEKKIVDGKEVITKIKIKENEIFIDAIMKIANKYPGKIQISIGNELSTKTETPITYTIPPWGIYPGKKTIVLAETIWVWDIANYLVTEWKMNHDDMGWGCMPGDVVQNDNGKFDVEDPMKAMQTLVNRIAERVSLIWNRLHREFHGMCGGYTDGVMSFWAQVVDQWVGKNNSGCGHMSTDGDNAYRPNEDRKYASKTDKLVASNGATYVRFNATATKAVYRYVINHCIPRIKDNNKVWISVLPQVWKIGAGNEGHLENAKALIAAYEEETGKTATNKGKVWVKPECQIGEVKKEICWDGSEIITHTCENGKWTPTQNVCPDQPTTTCGLNKWTQHLKTLDFRGAWNHLLGRHNI